eukprot:285410-Pelagomonas_calceolata.AAC.1
MPSHAPANLHVHITELKNSNVLVSQVPFTCVFNTHTCVVHKVFPANLSFSSCITQIPSAPARTDGLAKPMWLHDAPS